MYKNAVERFLKLKLISLIRDDETIDQLHHRVTAIVLVVMAGFFSAKTYWGGIDCWIPKEYDGDNFKPYIHQYCWISNLYRVPFSEELPLEVEERMGTHRSINFFRWVFIMFIVQALMFKFPNIIWRTFNTFSGINIRKVVEQSLTTQLDSEENREANMANLALVVDRWLMTKRRVSKFRSVFSKFFFCLGRRSGCYLTRLYLAVKLLYLLNLLAQFQILSVFLHFNYWGYGAEVAEMIADDATWKDLNHFPRVGMCDLEIRQLQNIQRHTVQCSLPLNMFLEKAYATLWFFMVILGIFTAISLFNLILEEIFSTKRKAFLDKYVKWLNVDSNSRLFGVFINRYLADDGIFLIRLLTYNTGELLTSDLLKQLWSRFQDTYRSDEETPSAGGNIRFPFFGRKLINRFHKNHKPPEGNTFEFPEMDGEPPATRALFSQTRGTLA